MEILVALVILGGGLAVAWGTGIGSSIASLFHASVEATSELYDKRAALSQLITFAVLADGEVTDAEAANLRHLFETSEQFTGDADEAIEHLRACARRASDMESLENTIRVVASDLDREWKEDAFRFVAVLALRGSGFGAAQHGFRCAPMSDPDALLEIFARGLDIDAEFRDCAIRSARATGTSAGPGPGSAP